jgi:hypothetical protein
LVESMAGNSTKKKAGKVASKHFIIQLLLTYFTDPESNAIRMVASQDSLFVRNINAGGATCRRKMPIMRHQQLQLPLSRLFWSPFILPRLLFSDSQVKSLPLGREVERGVFREAFTL